MPPIPIYAHSPINAAKAGGVTPSTAEAGLSGVAVANQNPAQPPPPPTTTQDAPYPPARPGAAPAAPTASTGTAVSRQQQQQQQQQSTPRPTPTSTQPLGSDGPPLPQPGAVPLPPSAASLPTGPPQATQTGLPPPPRAGEKMSHDLRERGDSVTSATSTNGGTTSAQHLPPQMAIPAPAAAIATQGAQRGTSNAATTTSFSRNGINIPPAPAVAAASPLEHPPGYQQDPTAGELNRHQRAAQDALEREEESSSSWAAGGGGDGEGGGVWGSVRGAVAAAGEKLASAEKDVWAKINKGM